MTEVLVAVGLFVFFVSVYGAVMVGGHLLEELELDQPASAPTGERGELATPTGTARADGQPVSSPLHV